MDELRNKSITDLRIIAQTLGVNDIFEKDKSHLLAEIDIKQRNLSKMETPIPQAPVFVKADKEDKAEPNSIVDVLKRHIEMGLNVKIEQDRWYMRFKERADEGTMTMPLKTVLACANKLMRP